MGGNEDDAMVAPADVGLESEEEQVTAMTLRGSVGKLGKMGDSFRREFAAEDDDADDVEIAQGKSRSRGVKLGHKHVLAIEKGTYLYDPELVARMVSVGRRLANVDHYTRGGVREISPRQAEALLGDLEDFLQISTKFTMKLDFLREYHEPTHADIVRGHQQSGWSWFRQQVRWNLGILCCRQRYMAGLERQLKRTATEPLEDGVAECLPRVMLPHTLERNRRQRMYGIMFDATLEVTNQASDWFFIIVKLSVLEGNLRYLFWISLVSLLLSYTLRILIAFSERKQVDWSDKRRVSKFYLGLMLSIIEPAAAYNHLTKRSFKQKEELQQGTVGESGGSLSTDPIATQAKSDYKAARASVLLTAVLLIQDLPSFAVELIFVIYVLSSRFEYVFYLVLISTFAHLARQLFEAWQLLKDIPKLRNLVNTRNLVFLNSLDDKYDQIVDGDGKGDGGSASMKEMRRLAKGRTIKQIADAFFDADFSSSSGSVLAMLRHRTGSRPNSQMGAYHEFVTGLAPALVPVGQAFSVVKTREKDGAGKGKGKGSVLPAVPGGSVLAGGSSRRKEAVNDVAAIRTGWFPRLFNRMEPRQLYSSIRSVELTDCVSVDGDTVERIARHCVNLQALNLSFCELVDDDALAALQTMRCSKLEKVVLDSCVRVTDVGVAYVAQGAGPSLQVASLRNMPLLTDASLKSLGRYCPNVRRVHFDRDALLVKAERKRGLGKEEGAITDSGLLQLSMGAGHSLQAVTLGNVSDRVSSKGLVAFLRHLNPFLRDLSLAGCGASLTDAVVEELSAADKNNNVFLRNLYLTNSAVTDAGVVELARRCNSLRVVALGGTSVSVEAAMGFWATCPDLQQVAYDDPTHLCRFFAQQFSLQADALFKVLERSGNEALEDELGESMALLREAVEPAVTGELAEALLPARPASHVSQHMEALLVQVVDLVDFVRRLRHRAESYSAEQRSDWAARLEERDVGRVGRVVATLRNTLAQATHASEEDAVRRPKEFPPTRLAPFGVTATRRINLRISFEQEMYTYIVPEAARGEFAVDPQDRDALRGKISPLNDITLGKGTDKLERYWSIPDDAAYYSWLYPVKNAKALKFHKDRGLDNAVLRFLTFGGYLYFDSKRHFVACSALTVGTALSFNGPFTISAKAVAQLEADNRWQDVTIASLIPEGSDGMSFCYLFTGEQVLPKSIPNKHGGFAYRIPGKEEGAFFALADIDDAIISE